MKTSNKWDWGLKENLNKGGGRNENEQERGLGPKGGFE